MDEKFKSRKFIVWITATVLLVLSFVVSVIVKDSTMTEVNKILAEGWSWISALYIGGNVAQKYITKEGGENEHNTIDN